MFLLWTFYLAISWLLIGIQADGNVGCLLSKRVCGKSEWCYDDFAFGRCLPLYDRISKVDLYRYGLEKDALSQLEHEIRRLFTAGYRWAHSYTQCIVKKILHSFRYKVNFERNTCENKQDDDLARALKYLEAEHELDPKDVAIIKFQPSLFDPKADYGDELYFPSSNSHHSLMEEDDSYVGVVKKYPGVDGELPTKGEKHEHKSKSHNYKRKKKEYPKHYDNKPLSDKEVLDLLQVIPYIDEDKDYADFVDYPVETELDEPQTWSFAKHKSTDSIDVNPLFYVDDIEGDFPTQDVIDAAESFHLDPTVAFERPHRYDVKKPGPYFKVNNYVFQKEELENQKKLSGEPVIFKFHPFFEEEDPSAASLRHQHLHDDKAEDFTAEGMSLAVPENKTPYVIGENENQSTPNAKKREDDAYNQDIPFFLNMENSDYLSPDDEMNGIFGNAINDDYSEELLSNADFLKDKLSNYKKNVPLYSVNDGFHDDNQFTSPSVRDSDRKKKKVSGSNYNMNLQQKPGDEFPTIETTKIKQAFHASPMAPNIQKSSVIIESNGAADHYDILDTSYAFIVVDKNFHGWKEGKAYVIYLQSLLKLPNETFSNIRQNDNKVTFKVNSNGINASIVATKAESLKNELYQKTGKMLTSAGIGYKTQFAVEELQNDNRIFVITFIICGVIAGAVIAVGVLYVVRRHARSREKLQNLTQLDTEASQDYQDLCRQRMASKNTEKPEPIHVAQRISSLSRDSETSVRSPSSRSSTSSWNEEPVISNMDISTGHMVLSYMEDHLTNKDRLDQEWVALCAYEADPAVVDAAIQPNNIKKNRYEDILPYDHSRVVLNDLTNIAGSDYINASTITDHDPRNPAYIATQGPLPHTSADFWQMIWEQGSVVIVMLTRLVENGMAMCHRYWPEEGSELYHIYEVHLVSEHIWCEDYLVRSFYLKNLKTGETRTVTQFHFLSWLDNGVPSSTKALLDFRRKVNKSYRGRSCPIVVHCSDGIGRTGTYCLIDMVLNRMAKGAKEIDIAATLEHIRDQRTAVVRTKAQFEFALMAVAEEVHAILKAMPQ